MSKSGKKVSKKKVLKIVLISLAVFIVLNLLGAAIGTSTSITHPKRASYDEVITEMQEAGVWGNFSSYDKEDYIVKGLDGYELHCSKISTPETVGTGKYLIYSHGHQSNMYAGSKYCDAFIELGFTCIIYDLRGHGPQNEKAICSMGGYEGQDLNYIIEDTYSRYGDVKLLGLHGESMGASTTLNALRYTDKVDFAVADCGFESLKFMVHDMYNDMYLYPFGACADLGFKLIYGIDDEEVSGIDALKGSNVPVLFVHGQADDWIDVENSEDMYAVASQYAYSELWLVEGAGHARSREIAGEQAYKEHIESFLINSGVMAEYEAEAGIEGEAA
jgi:pimeloyl-ACP methyl ester carboxylesterase